MNRWWLLPTVALPDDWIPLRGASSGLSEDKRPRSSQLRQLIRTRLGESMREGKPEDYPRTVVAAWQMSFQRIQREQPAAVALLRLCAFLAPDDIRMNVLLEGAGLLPKELRQAGGDEVRFDRAGRRAAALRAD